MRNINIYILFLLVLFTFSCEDELVEKAVLKSDPAANVLSDLPASSYVFVFEDQDEEFDAIQWTSPDFGFPASVVYTVEVDLNGGDFSEAVELLSTQELSAIVTVGDINEALLTLGATPEEATQVQFRVISTINELVVPLQSNLISSTITPFATTFEPIFIIGDAQSWDLLQAAELKATGPGTYEGVADFVNEGIFRFFEKPLWEPEQWGASYFAGGSIPPELVDNGDGDSNFRFTGTDGKYFVTVNLNTKAITMAEQNYPEDMFIIGGDQGWDLGAAFQLTPLGEGVFEGVGQFGSGNIWRFFEAPDWAAKQWNYNNFIDGTLPADLGGTTEGDANFTWNGATGLYKITVNTVDLIIEMEPATEPTLYIIGDDQGWDLGAALALEWQGNQVYTGTGTFTTNAIFRFFENPDWGAKQYNYNTFVGEGTIDPNLSGTTEGDANFTVVGTTGTYTIEVDLINLTIVMTQ